MESELVKLLDRVKGVSTFGNIGWVFLRLVINPSDIRPTFRLRDLTALHGFQLCLAKVRSDPASDAIIRDRYLAKGPHDLKQLAKLPEGTLGWSHARFMQHFQIPVVFYPDELSRQIAAGRVDDVSYLRMRARETHDVWHTVLGIPPDGFGEMEISTVYLKQMNLLLSGFLLAVGFLYMTINKPHAYQDLVESIIKGWTTGAQAKPLIGMRWEEMWDMPIVDVRRKLGVEVKIEAWDQMSMDELERDAQARFDSYVAREPPRGYDTRARSRFLASAML